MRFETQASPRARAKAKVDSESGQGGMERHHHQHTTAAARLAPALREHAFQQGPPLPFNTSEDQAIQLVDSQSLYAFCKGSADSSLPCSAMSFDAESESFKPVTSTPRSQPQAQVLH